ncbi:MAG: phosphohistidine phosphatase SixA [Chitinophagaceae bacterium]|nr:phosphohistidine phosphatase SixA [Chitinophagaceae bacterium]
MKKFPGIFFALLFLFVLSCKKDEKQKELVNLGKITSPEYENDLLFVNSANFQVQTNEPATFTSDDTLVTISSSGLITKIFSGEIAHFDINWTNYPGQKTRIYTLGATDDIYYEPYASFHIGEVKATDPNASYRQGWQTIHKLPASGESYAIILRHGDANWGKDNSKTNTDAPVNWWLSCDSTLARQLNPLGIQRATELGKIFKDLGLPIARVISSEFCRAKKTAELINAGPPIVTDPRLNHPSYNLTGLGQFRNMLSVVKELPVDNQMTLIVGHHPLNETPVPDGYATFPAASPFPWTGAYFIKLSASQEITYEGAVSWAMFKYYRDKKLNIL